MTRSAASVLLAALRRNPPAWALERVVDLAVVQLAEEAGILPVVAEVAAQHGVIPELDGAVVLGARRSTMSPTGVLLAAREESRARHADLDEIRAIAVRELRRAGVGFRHLKGGALRSTPVWRDFTARPTRDVDILVADAVVIPRIEATLLELGFARSDEVEKNQAWDDDHHDLPLVLPGRAGSLELHAASLTQRHRDRMTLDVPDEEVDTDVAATLRHVIVHAQLQDDAMLQLRLPLVALLDVAFALEAGVVTPAELIGGFDDRLARRAARVHLGLAARLRGTSHPGVRSSWLRWRLSRLLFGHPVLSHLVREAVFAPRALSRPVMTRRAGHPLSAWGLAKARWRFLRERVPRAMRAASGATPADASPSLTDDATSRPAPRGQKPEPGQGDRMVNPGTDARPIRRGGFEEAWSSSGLVLVDLESDVLHHLNAPAAVVLELVGDRSFAEIVEAYAALSDGDRGTASDAVRVALDGLAEIGAIDGWALS